MTHQQILDKLGAKELVLSIDEDLSRLTFTAMCYEQHESIKSRISYVLPRLLLRWNCALKADKAEVSDNYKHITIIALATSLHKYGFSDKSITANALKGIDKLNKTVSMNDDFFRKSDEIKKLLSTKPVELKRKPSTPKSITFYRPKDVVSIQLNGKYYAAYVHEHTAPNESPILEFYNGVFDSVPKLNELKKLKAKGLVYNDEVERSVRYAIYGMKYSPDLANQIKLISAGVETSPSSKHLEQPIGIFGMSDIFKMQDNIKQIFKPLK